MDSKRPKNNRLLYVEDDEVLANITVKALTKRHYEVIHVDSVSAAKERLNTYDFAFAILDLKLDNETSLALIPSLKQLNNDIKILILTGYASIATAVQAVKLGASNYLSKPATIDDILSGLHGETVEQDEQEQASEKMSVKRLEWEHIQRVLAENNGNISATARELKMHRRTLQRKLQKKPVAE